MTTLGQTLTSFRRFFAFGILAISAMTTSAYGQTPPYSLFQYASITGSGNTLTATQIPVVVSAGVTVYVNVTLTFTPDSSGNLTVSNTQVTPAPTILASLFKAGNYVGPSTVLSGNALVTISGPGVTAGGATEWTLVASSGANSCTYPQTVTWYVGPLTSNPIYSRLQSAGITSTAWSYGVAGGNPCGNGEWGPKSNIIGLSQVGNTITLVTFTDGGGNDRPTPLDQITYTLKP